MVYNCVVFPNDTVEFNQFKTVRYVCIHKGYGHTHRDVPEGAEHTCLWR